MAEVEGVEMKPTKARVQVPDPFAPQGGGDQSRPHDFAADMGSDKDSARWNPRVVRAIYVVIFLAALVIGVVLRDKGGDLLKDSGLDCSTDRCHGKVAVYRVFFALTLFEFVLGLLLIGVHESDEPKGRYLLHNGMWWIKIPVLIGLMVVMFFLPNEMFTGFASAALYLSGIFILMQIILLLDFAYRWNENWVAKGEEKGRHWLGLILLCAIFLLVLEFTMIGLMYGYYTGEGCGTTAALITVTLVMGLVLTCLSVATEHGALLPGALISVYGAFLCWGAVNGTPDSYGCKSANADDTQIVLGLIFAILSISWSVTSAASNSSRLAHTGNEEGEDLGQKYWYFHFVLAFGSMYIAMVLTGWKLEGSEEALTVGEGWSGVYVRTTTQYVTYALYFWTLIAPYVCKNREF